MSAPDVVLGVPLFCTASTTLLMPWTRFSCDRISRSSAFLGFRSPAWRPERTPSTDAKAAVSTSAYFDQPEHTWRTQRCGGTGFGWAMAAVASIVAMATAPMHTTTTWRSHALLLNRFVSLRSRVVVSVRLAKDLTVHLPSCRLEDRPITPAPFRAIRASSGSTVGRCQERR